MSDLLLEVENLYVEYRTDEETVRAVNGCSFCVNKGETLGIVGETGAGKTTTALAIMRLLPDRTAKIIGGNIRLNGQELLHLPEEEMRYKIRGERISMIFQDPMTALNPVMTIRDQIAEAIHYHALDLTNEEIDARIEEVLTLVGISPNRKNEYPHQFSGGMKQRVVIAIALSCEPELLIADEPTTALDVTIQAQVLAMVDSLRARLGMAMILITHDLGIVAQTCDKVAVMYAGEIIETGTLEDIFTGAEHHPYTVGLFGAIPNLKEETDRLSPIPGLMPDPSNLPKGCYFYERCPKAMEICSEVHPVLYIGSGHPIACHLFNNGNYGEVSK